MFEEQLKILLEKKWTEDELKLINRLTSNLGYYKKLIPKSLKQDIAEALQMCNLLKVELETYKEINFLQKSLIKNEEQAEKRGEEQGEEQAEEQGEEQGEERGDHCEKHGEENEV